MQEGSTFCFGKRSVLTLRLDLKETRESFFWRGRGRSVHVQGLMMEIARERPVESLVRRMWILRVSEAERRVQKDV